MNSLAGKGATDFIVHLALCFTLVTVGSLTTKCSLCCDGHTHSRDSDPFPNYFICEPPNNEWRMTVLVTLGAGGVLKCYPLLLAPKSFYSCSSKYYSSLSSLSFSRASWVVPIPPPLPQNSFSVSELYEGSQIMNLV